MRHRQLEFGRKSAGDRELQRPIVSAWFALPRRRIRGLLQGAEREHGGSGLEGTYASVIGAPRGGRFRPRRRRRTRKIPLAALEKEIAAADPAEKRRLQSRLQS